MDDDRLTEHDVERIAESVATKLNGSANADIAAAAAHKVVQEMTVKGLAFVGVDVADKKQIEQLKADLSFVRSFRHFTERTGRQVSSAITQAVIWGIVALVVIGFLFWARNGVSPNVPPPPAITK